MGAAIQTIRSLMTAGLILFTYSSGYAAPLMQCGTGDMTVGIKKAGQATLWMQDCKQNWQQQSLRMEFSYTASIPAWAFKKAATVILSRNLSEQEWEQHKAIFAQLTQLYQPINSGDRYQLDYDETNQRLVLSLNSKTLGHIQSSVAHQYFLIWLGSQPFNQQLKRQLLG